MQRVGLIAAWVAVAAITTTVAWQVVGAAETGVSDPPLTPVLAVTTPDSTGATPTGTSPSSVVTSTSGTTGSSSTSTTPTTSGTATTTTTVGGTSTTSAPSSGKTATTTVVSEGGTVTATGTDPHVELVAVVATPGWSYQVTQASGDRVEVRFENVLGGEARVRIEWEDGRLSGEVD